MEYRIKTKYIAYDLQPIDINHLPNTTLTKICPDGIVVCTECGAQATHQGSWRHIHEMQHIRHTGYLNPISIENDVTVLFFMTVDHILPKSLGGANKLSNFRPMCYRCNTNRKNVVGKREILEYLTDPYKYTTQRRAKKYLGITKVAGEHYAPRHPLAGWLEILTRFPELESHVHFA